MTNNQKLKVLAAILFVLIIVLIGMLIYATTIHKNDDKPASNTADVSTTASSTNAVQPGQSSTSEEAGTIDLKLYKYDAEDYDKPKEIVTVPVDKKLYEDDITAAINKLLETTGLSIKKAVVSGELLTVDLSKEIEAKFNMGSAGGITNTNILAATLVNLPGINKLEVTVDGVAGVEGDHFSFNGTFVKADGDKSYEFTSSGRVSK
ncbi:MAG: hypothetical protein K0R50_570 [Eubacterium sp.]|jgi:hypothetical protein|nr:hypothetical protein [Eubacterium sp.]